MAETPRLGDAGRAEDGGIEPDRRTRRTHPNPKLDLRCLIVYLMSCMVNYRLP